MFSKKVRIDSEFKNLAESFGLDPKEVLSLFMKKFVSDLTISGSPLTKWLELEFPVIGQREKSSNSYVDLKTAVYSLEPRVKDVLERSAAEAATKNTGKVSFERVILNLLNTFPPVESYLGLDPFSLKRYKLYLKNAVSTEKKNDSSVVLDEDLVDFLKYIYKRYVESGVAEEITLELFFESYCEMVLPKTEFL